MQRENKALNSTKAHLADLGLRPQKTNANLSAEQLVLLTLEQGEGKLSDTGALCINTGKFTGRSPKDRYIVKDQLSQDTVDWNSINQPISTTNYQGLKSMVVDHLNGLPEVFVHQGIACADEDYQIGVRVVAEKPWSAQFAHNMFRRLTDEQQETFYADWNILCSPTCFAKAADYGLNADNFVVVSFKDRVVLIGGTGYTGEIKKSIFSILNYILPLQRNVLSMHCSANVGKEGDTAIFFGLSGTGKTTLSTDPDRQLIGDDEHGWSQHGIFNFEGGCYAKCINLSEEKEPEIYQAIKPGAILENIGFVDNTNSPNFADTSITENTRVSYPLHHIANIKSDSKGGNPEHIFFLTCDAFGVLPPVSKLTKEQAMYHFISGYTAKVAGTETGITEPQATFSACFGAPFLPLHPGKYAEMLGQKIDNNDTHIWLINTGWTGGANPAGNRISLKYTRAIIKAVLANKLNDVDCNVLEQFDLAYPSTCPDVPQEILNPRATWASSEAYDKKAEHLAQLFVQNFKKYEEGVSPAIRAAAPRLLEDIASH